MFVEGGIEGFKRMVMLVEFRFFEEGGIYLVGLWCKGSEECFLG